MRSFDDTRFKTTSAECERLDTPSSVGFRSGMSCSGVIARKLGIVYDVNEDVPTAMRTALQALDRRLASSR